MYNCPQVETAFPDFKQRCEEKFGRKITVYEKLRWSLRAGSEKWGVEKLPPTLTQSRPLLILGTGRSGTRYIATALNEVGLDFTHEHTSSFGCCTHFYHSDHDWYFMSPTVRHLYKTHVGERLSDFYFQQLWHIVRHPLKTIPSMTAVFTGLNYEFLEELELIPWDIKDPTLRNMHTYFAVNRKIDTLDPEIRFRLEDVPLVWPKLMKKVGLPADIPLPKLGLVNRSHGYRAAKTMTWEIMRAKDPLLTRSIANMARGYGYDV